MDFADKIGKGGNWALSMLIDLLTSLSWNFYFQEEIEHLAQSFRTGAKPRSVTATGVSSLHFWKVGRDFLC